MEPLLYIKLMKNNKNNKYLMPSFASFFPYIQPSQIRRNRRMLHSKVY